MLHFAFSFFYFPGVEIQCIGHFKLLFFLVRLESYTKVQEMTLHVLVNVTGSTECIDDIAASQVFQYLIQAIYSLPEQRAISLTVLHSLVGDTRLVKECIAQGVEQFKAAVIVFLKSNINKENFVDRLFLAVM
jgi:hypothetical protein